MPHLKQFLLLLPLLFSLVLGAQENRDGLALGEWKSHLPYRAGISVAQSATNVYFASNEALMSVDKQEHSVQLFNKVSGLSESRFREISFNDDLGLLFIAYENSNIDLLYENGKVINVNDIKRKSITGDKRINHINFVENIAWLSCGFGIVKMDLNIPETKSTIFTPYQTYGMELFNDYIYITTSNGLYRVLNDENINIQDFSIWERLSSADGLPSSYRSRAIESLNGKLYASVDEEVYVFDGTSWSFHFEFTNYSFLSFERANGFLIGNTTSTFTDKIIRIYPDGSGGILWDQDLAANLPKAIEDEQGNIWFADNFKGFGVKAPDYTEKKIKVQGPPHINTGDIYVHKDEVWVASSNLEPKWNPKANSSGLYSFIDGTWDAINPWSDPKLLYIRDINVVKIHPETDVVYAGTFSKGIIEYNRDSIKLFNETNSSLGDAPLSLGSFRVTGLDFDNENNLWVGNFSSPNPISVYTNDQQWQAFSIPYSFYDLTKVVVDKNGYKWFATNSNGVLVYDSGNDILSPQDDRYARLTTSNTELQSNDIHSIGVDRDGDVWVGANEGIVVFECVSQLFDNGCGGRRPVAEEGGIDEYLLKSEQVNAIAVDGANRKWLGTTSGVFVIDDNEKTVHIFNEENSPLFNNHIIDIAINSTCGEVFFSTEQGIISYRNRAIKGLPAMNKESVLVYPNPVRQDYVGDIAIKGLVEDADVKITDVSGKLVYETTALGGQAIWNGYDYNGRKANTGVYLVLAAGSDGIQKVVSKFLVVN